MNEPLFRCDPVHVGLPAVPVGLSVVLAAPPGELRVAICASGEAGSADALGQALDQFVLALIDWYRRAFHVVLVIVFEVASFGPGVDVAPYVALLSRVSGIRVELRSKAP